MIVAAELPHELSEGTVNVMATVVAATVANGYYVQPLLVQIGAAVDLPAGLVGILPALTQVGLGIGLVTLLPLADSLSARRVLVATMPLQVAALLVVAASGDAAALMAGCLAIGLFGITPYVLPPYASLRVREARLGAVTGMLTRGVICGILLARVIAGLVADQFGWRAVYLLAASATVAALGVVAKVVGPQPPAAPTVGYGRLVASLIGLLASEPELRIAALCQALTFASFNAFWLGSTLYLHARFGWGPGAIGAVGLLGAASALCAPVFGRSAQRFGPRRARPIAVAAMFVAWLLFRRAAREPSRHGAGPGRARPGRSRPGRVQPHDPVREGRAGEDAPERGLHGRHVRRRRAVLRGGRRLLGRGRVDGDLLVRRRDRGHGGARHLLGRKVGPCALTLVRLVTGGIALLDVALPVNRRTRNARRRLPWRRRHMGGPFTPAPITVPGRESCARPGERFPRSKPI